MKETRITFPPTLSWCIAKLLPMPVGFAIFLAPTLNVVFPDLLNAAAEPLQTTQLVHVSWTTPQQISALAQAHDGSLPDRNSGESTPFHEVTFSGFFSPAGDSHLPTDKVLSLLVTADGALCAGLRTENSVRIKEVT